MNKTAIALIFSAFLIAVFLMPNKLVSQEMNSLIINSPLTDPDSLQVTAHINPSGTEAIIEWELVQVPTKVVQSLDIINYIIFRVSDIQVPCDPISCTLTPIATPMGNWYIDYSYGALAPGNYAWAIQIVYEDSVSQLYYSNIVGGLNHSNHTINVVNTAGNPINNAAIELSGLECAYSHYYDTTEITGQAFMEEIWNGNYDVEVTANGYTAVNIDNVTLFNDTTINITMEYGTVTGLVFDTLTAEATWDLLPYCLGYYIYLDGGLVCMFPQDVTQYHFSNLYYGHEYQVCVSAGYSDGASEYTCSSGISGYLTPPENLMAEVVNHAAELSWTPPKEYDLSTNEYITPVNVLGYNLYRNEVLISYLVETALDTIYYTDEDIAASCPPYNLYSYRVTATYDLEPYGYPSETGESTYEGPVEVVVGNSESLPMLESWSSGGFDAYQWEHQSNWNVDNQNGNPVPCALFDGSPELTDYTSNLISVCLDAIPANNPWIDGQLWLDFDLKLGSVNNTGSENFRVNLVKNDSSFLVYEMDNGAGSFDWQAIHLDITDPGFGSCFMLEFVADGSNSSDISSWMLDNIEVYRTCAGPTDLSFTDLGNHDYQLNWNAPSISRQSHPANRTLEEYNIWMNAAPHGATSDTFYLMSLPVEGIFVFEVTASYTDCDSDTAAGPVTISVLLSTPEIMDNHEVVLFPNPAKNGFRVESNNQITQAELFDVIGNRVTTIANDKAYFEINTTDLQNGIYTILLKFEDHSVVTRKVVVMH